MLGMGGFAMVGTSTCSSLRGVAPSLGGGVRLCSRRFFSPGRHGMFMRGFKMRNVLFNGIRAMTSEPGAESYGTKPDTTSREILAPYIWADSKNPRICILGGGFGGLYTALRLESLVWTPENRPQILLVDQCERFIFKPMLYELLSREVDVWEIAPQFSELLAGTSIHFLKDTVKSVSSFDALDDEKKASASSIGGRVYLESGMHVDYDWLVLALGAETKMDIVPGAKEHALPFSTLEDALEVEKRLEKLERERFGSRVPIEVAVVGSGYCGVELAATVAERLGDRGKVQVIDVNSQICPLAPAGNREKALEVLSSRNVKLELGNFVTNIIPVESTEPGKKDRHLLEIKPAARNTRRGPPSSFHEVDLVLWTVGNKVLLPSGSNSLPTNGRGQADTDDTLRVKGHPRIFAIGDSAGTKDASGRLLPTTAQVALQQADYAGWNLWAAINNRPLLPFRYQHLGEMMTLGRYNGAVTPSFIDDVTLDGLLGHTARKLAYLYRLPTNEHRLKVGVSWFAKSAVDTLSFVQNSLFSIVTSR